MADSTPNNMTAPSRFPDLGIFSEKFEITSVKTDPVRWNKDWEKGLRSLSGHDVYAGFRDRIQDFLGENDSSALCEEITRRALKYQQVTREMWDVMMTDFRTAWALVEEKERKKHLMQGLQAACEFAVLGEDSRALCPEISVSSMLKDRGKGFVAFISNFHENLKEADSEALYTLPSQWWAGAVDASDLTENTHISQLLTAERNEFLALFAVQTGLSVMGDFAHGSPGMDPVTKMMTAEPGLARVWGETMSSAPSKPVIRCENCGKSPDMFEGDKKFMLCSACKAKLNFTVHYCSQECQKEDWRTHKKNCGKQKVSKRLKGTINDPFWQYPSVPDHLRSLPINDSGSVSISAMGFATPDPSHPRSPALQRQISLLSGDVEADYFLFDEVQRPIRVEVPSPFLKLTFRTMRGDAMSARSQKGVEVIAEYLLNRMGDHPGLSRERILQQFGEEYGEDVIELVLEFEKLAEKNGLPPGTTFLDNMGKKLSASLPVVNKRP